MCMNNNHMGPHCLSRVCACARLAKANRLFFVDILAKRQTMYSSLSNYSIPAESVKKSE